MTPAAAQTLGPLPEWNLADLYPSPDSAEVARDLSKVMDDAKALQELRSTFDTSMLLRMVDELAAAAQAAAAAAQSRSGIGPRPMPSLI